MRADGVSAAPEGVDGSETTGESGLSSPTWGFIKAELCFRSLKMNLLENRLVPEGRYSETSSSVITERLQCLREMMERETVQTESTRKKVGNVKESVKVKINHSILCNQWTTVVMWSLFSGELLRTKIISEMLFWTEISSVLKPCCQTPESVWTRTSQTRQRATWCCDNSYTENSQNVV